MQQVNPIQLKTSVTLLPLVPPASLKDKRTKTQLRSLLNLLHLLIFLQHITQTGKSSTKLAVTSVATVDSALPFSHPEKQNLKIVLSTCVEVHMICI